MLEFEGKHGGNSRGEEGVDVPATSREFGCCVIMAVVTESGPEAQQTTGDGANLSSSPRAR